MLPGFNDARVDFVDGGAAGDGSTCSTRRTLVDLEHRVRDWAEANPDQPWVLGRGWHRELFADGRPTRQLLDRLVPDRPARLLSADGRMAWVNTPALRLAKITRKTRRPRTGADLHEARTGEPTGLLEGSAIALVDRLLPAATEGDRERALRTAIATAPSSRVTSVQDVADGPAELAAYAQRATYRRSAGPGLRRVAGGRRPADADLDQLEVTTRKFPDDPLLKAGAVSVAARQRRPRPPGQRAGGRRACDSTLTR